MLECAMRMTKSEAIIESWRKILLRAFYGLFCQLINKSRYLGPPCKSREWLFNIADSVVIFAWSEELFAGCFPLHSTPSPIPTWLLSLFVCACVLTIVSLLKYQSVAQI